jgi:hypothetical protein
MNPRYPVYIVSKGRWESRMTSRMLERLHVPYRIVIEPQEYERYSAVISPCKILTLPFSNLGLGSIPARNWAWEHAISEGHERHWILDDNINQVFRNHLRRRIPTTDGVGFRVCEDFVDRYTNVPMAGLHYSAFAKQGRVTNNWNKPFYLNTRVYSCILLSNRVPHRWRGRYNEDTDLSLRFLKDGYCTVLLCAFLCGKQKTMSMKGGNTDELYCQDRGFDGRLEMARSLRRQHPDVVKITRKWGRWQHQVDYRPFRGNKLIRKPSVVIPEGVNEYGMRLAQAGMANGSSAALDRPSNRVIR